MDAREQCAITPLFTRGWYSFAPLRSSAARSRAVFRTKRSPKHYAVRFEREERLFDELGIDVERRRQRAGGGGSDDCEAPAEQLANGCVARPDSRRARWRRIDGGIERDVRMDRPQFGDAFGGDPDRQRRRRTLRHRQLFEQLSGDVSDVAGRQESRGDQRVVQLVGIAWIGTLFAPDAINRVRIEGAEIAARRRLRPASRLDVMAP